MYDKRNKVHLFDVDSEIDLKTISGGTLCILCEKHLEEKAPANETVKEFEVFSDNRYSGGGMRNNQVGSHPCGNKLMKEASLYDNIKDLYMLLVDGSSSIANVRRHEKDFGKKTLARDLN